MNSSIPYQTKRGLRKKKKLEAVCFCRETAARVDLKLFTERITSSLLTVILMGKLWFKVGLFHAALEHQDARIVAG